MTKKKSKKKIRKKQKSIKDGFEQDQEEQEKENPKMDAPAQKSEQSRVPDSIEPENQKLTAEKTAAIASYIKDPDYRLRCKAAIDILMAKLKMINAELSGQKKRTVISQTTSRIKSAESIYAKLLKKGLEPDFETARKNLKDLIGIRVVCPFEDELYQVAESLEMQKDIENVRIKDYIKNPKKNGYKSLHLIVKVPIYSAEGEQKELVEIQLRTIAMDYWSVLEYELYYKKRDNAEIEAELKKYAEENMIEADFFVAMESGITDKFGTWLNLTTVYIENKNEEGAVGFGPAYPIPDRYIDEVKKKELSYVLAKLFESKELKAPQGGIFQLADIGFQRPTGEVAS